VLRGKEEVLKNEKDLSRLQEQIEFGADDLFERNPDQAMPVISPFFPDDLMDSTKPIVASTQPIKESPIMMRGIYANCSAANLDSLYAFCLCFPTEYQPLWEFYHSIYGIGERVSIYPDAHCCCCEIDTD
jgi:hypothetical protein